MTQIPTEAKIQAAPQAIPPAPILSSFSWTKAKWAAAACRVPALLGCLVLAIHFNQSAAGVVAAGAALSVGLVGNRQIAGSSFLAMVVTTIIMATSAWTGTLIGGSFFLCLIVTAVWGLAFAFLTIHDEDLGWLTMQGVICLVIAQGFPNHDNAALARGLAVGGGGLLQIGILGLIEFLRRGIPWHIHDLELEPPPVRTYTWRQLLASFRFFSPAWRYALRVALTLVMAVEIASALKIQNGYWLPMTTLIILKPDFYRTYSGAIQRVIGTFLGVGIASLIAHLFHPSVSALIAFACFFSFGCFAFLKINPISFTAALTAYVVFLISTTGLPEAAITGHRLILTALGSGLALASRFLGKETIVSLFGRRLKT